MGQGALKSLCGKNLGYFPDDHTSPTNSDDEDEADSEAEQYMPKNYRKAIRASKKGGFLSKIQKAAPTKDVAAGVRVGWGPHMVRVEAGRGRFLNGVKAHKAKITLPMLEKLTTMGALHTVEITHCSLKDFPPIVNIDDLTVVQLSHNKIRRIGVDDSGQGAKSSTLEKFICDWNRIENISPGVLCGAFVGNLLAINLSHNELTFLPRDFGLGATKLRYLDLGFNKLTDLPDSISNCKQLQLLHLHHNLLTDLPESIGQFQELRKLFVSYNHLKNIPDSVGHCIKLEKVRLAQNELRYLPGTFIELWKQPADPYNKNGCLEELVVEGNPLVQPSITAFEMGGTDGLNRAFKLFFEWLQEKEEEKRRQEELDRQKALENGHQSALADGEGPDDIPQEPEHHGTGGLAKAMLVTKALSRPQVARSQTLSEGEDVGKPKRDRAASRSEFGNPYYFKHVKNGAAEVAEIREMESLLLLRKKTMYIEQQWQLARKMEINAQQLGKPVPPHLRQFLVEDFNVMHFDGKIPVTDLDLYFNLMVFSVKPMFSTCEALFDKFQTKDVGPGVDPFLTREEWDNLCNRVPVRLPADVQNQMWDLLNVGDGPDGGIGETEFIAGCHIHDIEEQDPFIRRVAQVQRLDYYDMDVDEMRERLKARGAAEAALPLSFDDDGGDGQKRKAFTEVITLPPMEGERVVRCSDNQLQARAHTEVAVVDGAARKTQVSMTNAQYIENDGADSADGSESEGGGKDSDALSREEDSDLSDFDAQEVLAAAEKAQQERQRALLSAAQKKEAESKGRGRRVKAITDATSGDASRSNSKEKKPDQGKPKQEGCRKKKKSVVVGGRAKDPRFRTDVFEVRQALREAHRNLPLMDFRKLVAFTVRGMKRIVDQGDDSGVSYWHIDDPTFRGATGLGRLHTYAESLLLAMGFVPVEDKYWVWPEKHLRAAVQGLDWGHDNMPPGCQGLSRARLHDMVNLLKNCQQGMIEQGSRFRGHFS